MGVTNSYQGLYIHSHNSYHELEEVMEDEVHACELSEIHRAV